LRQRGHYENSIIIFIEGGTMKWNATFSPIKSMTEAEAKSFMDTHSTGSYQLVDVRQPGEYEEYHIPGATLVPLNVLTETGGDLNPEKPTIVYCRSGGRSQAAGQFLAGQGFKEVYDIGSNIASWLGIQVPGEVDLNLSLINPDAEFSDVWKIAYAMEEGLQRFYLALEAQETRDEYKQVFKQLAGFEDLHKERLQNGYNVDESTTGDLATFIQENPNLVETGDLSQMSPLQVVSQLTNLIDIFGLAMAIEAQSLDLYTRFSAQAAQAESKKLFQDLADEEKAHLNYLTKEMDKVLS